MLSTSFVLPILSLATAAVAGPMYNAHNSIARASATGVTEAAVATDSASSTSSDATGTEHSGAITYYNTGGGQGACGTTLADTDAICALSTTLYDQCTYQHFPA